MINSISWTWKGKKPYKAVRVCDDFCEVVGSDGIDTCTCMAGAVDDRDEKEEAEDLKTAKLIGATLNAYEGEREK